MTTDVPAARQFYCDVVGWGAQEAQVAAGYTLFTVDGTGLLGLMAVPEEAGPAARPSWMGYISVDDVDAMAARIEKLGGKLEREPVDIPGVIRFCAVSDPQGAAFLIAKAMNGSGPPAFPGGKPGTVGWHELYARDGEAAFDFYAAAFGWTRGEAMDMGPAGKYQLINTGTDTPVGAIMNKPASVPAPYWGFYFNVAALDAALARATANGGKVLNGPMEVPGGSWIANLADPQGALFSLAAPKR